LQKNGNFMNYLTWLRTNRMALASHQLSIAESCALFDVAETIVSTSYDDAQIETLSNETNTVSKQEPMDTTDDIDALFKLPSSASLPGTLTKAKLRESNGRALPQAAKQESLDVKPAIIPKSSKATTPAGAELAAKHVRVQACMR
jgi:hypothetical protein